MEKHGATIVKLQQQLESLTAMKKEHEETLLLKFKDLLNSKKTKIRELNRALDAAATIEGAEGKPARPPGPLSHYIKARARARAEAETEIFD